MRYIDCAEFIYILNGYNDYIWNFDEYVIEYYKRYKEEKVWQVYMSKLAQCLVKDLPPYISLIEETENNVTTEQNTKRLIDKVNKYNTGGTE